MCLLWSLLVSYLLGKVSAVVAKEGGGMRGLTAHLLGQVSAVVARDGGGGGW